MKFISDTLQYINYINKLNIKIPNHEYYTFPINFNYNTNYKIINQKNNLIGSRFLPSQIEKIIINLPYFTTIHIDNLIINLYGTQNNTFFRKQIKYIKILSKINKFFSDFKNYKKNIIISIYFTDFKKYLDSQNIISSININSGFSYQDKHFIKNIIIFRKQEWKKVFIHELIHAYNIDNFKSISTPFIDGKDMTYEALTEYISLIIHSQMISYLTKIPFKEIIQNEIKFNIIQSRKILNFWNIKNFNDFYKIKVSTESSPFSYFIFKNELFLNYDKYKKQLNNYQLPKILLDYFFPIFKYNYKYFDNNLRMSLYELE